MKLSQLRHFIEVVDSGSISAASEKLFLSQPNLSRSIHLLEEELGNKLLIRSVQGVVPTPLGRQVYYYAKSIREQVVMLESLKDVKEEGNVYRLRMAVSGIYLQDDLIIRFQEENPCRNAEISFHEITAEKAMREVTEGTVDFALLVLNDRQMPVFLKMTESYGLEAQIWDRSPLYIHVHEKHDLSQKEAVRVSDLKNYTYVHPPHDFFANLNLLMHEESLAQRISKKTITVTNYHAVLQILQYEGAYMVGNQWQKKELSNYSIKSILLENSETALNFVFLSKGSGNNNYLPEPSQVFLRMLQETYCFKEFKG